MRSNALFGARLPRYQVVAQALMRDIEEGRYRVGDMLPTEAQLGELYGVSRYTVREAVRRLTEAGLITRRAGVGTTVKAQAARVRYTATVSDLTELFSFTRQTRLQVLDTTWLEDDPALPADVAGQRWLSCNALRFVAEGAEPIAYVQMLIHPAYEAIRADLERPGVTVYRLVESLHGERIAEVRQVIGCTAIPAEVAAHLGVEPGSPGLRVRRYYQGEGGELFSVALNTYPQDRFDLETRWRLDMSAD